MINLKNAKATRNRAYRAAVKAKAAEWTAKQNTLQLRLTLRDPFNKSGRFQADRLRGLWDAATKRRIDAENVFDVCCALIYFLNQEREKKAERGAK